MKGCAGDGKREESRPRRPPWSEFRAALDAEEFRPSKALGQNFLLDDNMARAIANDAAVGAGDFVLEVGPGCGFLSVHLAHLGVDLLAVEIDRRLYRVASRFLEPYANARLLRADVMATKRRLAPEVLAELPGERAWHLVSNLPYGVAGPLLGCLARIERPPLSMTVLVQREVAERICARPGEGAWGALTAKLAVVYRARLVRRVGANLFWPRPRVESAVARLELASAARADLAAYDELVEGLFQRRRKGLRGALGGLLGSTELAALCLARCGLDPRARPEILGPEELLGLAAVISLEKSEQEREPEPE